MTEAVTTVLGAIAGFLTKSARDLYWKQRQDKKALQYRKRLDVLEQQLSRFYWPRPNQAWQTMARQTVSSGC